MSLLEEAIDLPAGARVVVAMSGGVDSSVVAALLHERGHEVVGITLQLYGQRQMAAKGKTCCAGQDLADAKRVAEDIGFAHYVLDFEARFRQAVIEDFASTYASGRTPVPCVRCNERVKFQDLLQIARDLGAAALATGHYARRLRGRGGTELHQGSDQARDQSYFLFKTTAAQLDFLRFPLGALDKCQTRAMAARLGLAVAAKPDSQDICFVPDGDHAALVGKLRPEALLPGELHHVDGRVLGRHRGVARFTVGQRRGLGVALQERTYVTGIDAATRTVTVGPRQASAAELIEIEETNWLAADALAPDAGPVSVKHRYNEPAVAAVLAPSAEPGRALVRFAEAQSGVAPGQACVAYRGTRLLGGGWIRLPHGLATKGADGLTHQCPPPIRASTS